MLWRDGGDYDDDGPVEEGFLPITDSLGSLKGFEGHLQCCAAVIKDPRGVGVSLPCPPVPKYISHAAISPPLTREARR